MPRVAKKQPASEPPITKTNEEASNGVVVAEMPNAKSKPRSKKITAAAPAAEVEDVEPTLKRASGRGKKKPSADEENGVVAVSVTEEKPKGRAKKAAVAEEATTSKSRAKKEKTPAVEESAPVKSRAKKEKPLALEEPAATSKSRAKKEKTPALEEPVVAAAKETKARGRKKKDATKENVEVNGVDEIELVKKRAKKPTSEIEVPETVSKTKNSDKPEASTKSRARGTKRMADSEITEMLEEGDEMEPTAASTSKKRGKKTTDEGNGLPAESVAPKKRGKKSADEPVAEAGAGNKRGKKPTKGKENEEVVAAKAENKTVRGRKRVAASVEPEEEVMVEVATEASGSKTSKAKKETVGEPTIDDFAPPAGKDFNFKISSWNVAGLRAWLKKDGLKFVDFEEPDIFCLQETKCANEQLPDEVVRLPGYHPYWLCMPGGYAGVAIYSKIMPIHVEYGIGNKEFDDVGRIITAEYEKFYLINVYVPNSGRKLVNLEPRMRWEQLFHAYVKKLDALKPVVICGDMNVSHLEIDLANPKTNTRNAGFTKEERDKMTELLELGFVDTFRHFYPKRTGAYTFWTYMSNSRARNVGWRLDYCIVSERFLPRVVDNCMRSVCMGSDHCPITIFLNI